ncbi:hypothetical protein BJX68DRAFT_191371 [Aspergillus pseudodeflectus]|uniref:AsmA-like C-terminal domain-containing protein n=1 Tax=Aspergillus pseudodeflectus TaxID=176178 RepID=A0ABR4KZX2_9EURO
MPDLQYLGGFQMKSQAVDSIYFKELRSVSGRLNVTAQGSETGASAGAHVLFPKLKDAGAVHIEAGQVLINFLSLETVQGDLILSGNPKAPLPALQSAGFIRIQGTPSFIHLPSLRTAGPPSGPTALSTGSGMDINQGDLGISLEIPLLEAVVGELSIQGTIISLELPSLETVSGALHFSVLSSVDLPELRSATEIELEGQIDQLVFFLPVLSLWAILYWPLSMFPRATFSFSLSTPAHASAPRDSTRLTNQSNTLIGPIFRSSI